MEKTLSIQSNHQSTIRAVTEIPGATELETRVTNCANSTAPVHSINNANERVTHRRSLPAGIPFYPGPTYRPHPNQLDHLHQKVIRVNKIQIAQK